MAYKTHHSVVVIGGGNGGVSIAARLRREGVDDIAIIEPRLQHYYKPLFSHVGGGTAKRSTTVRSQASVTPNGVDWLRDSVVSIHPGENTVVLGTGKRHTYDHVVVCPGIQQNWEVVPGLVDALATDAVASHYDFDLVAKTSQLLRDLRSGTAVFVQPPGPSSCAGAAQKPMYQACDYWRAIGVLDDIRVVMVVPDATIFGLDHIDRELDRVIAEYGIEVRTSSILREVDGEAQTVMLGAVDSTGESESLRYDVLNVVPQQSAPDWLKGSELPAVGDDGGFVEVDTRTLRHPRFPNVWSIGDAAATTNSKSGGALRDQTFALAKNLSSVLRGGKPTEIYDGYSVCPFTVSRSSVVFAEFDDKGNAEPTIPFWKSMYRENRVSWIFDRHILPWVYWNLILKGRA